MKTVTRKSLNELAKIMPVISEMNQKMYLGGTSGSTGAFDESGTTGYTGVPDITGSASGPIIYDGGWTGSAGGSYGGYGNSDGSGSTSGTTGVTGYYGTSGYDSGFTGSYTGAYDGSSGCLNNSGANHSVSTGGISGSNYGTNNNDGEMDGSFDSGTAYPSNRPCSYDEYCIRMESGTWQGGYVYIEGKKVYMPDFQVNMVAGKGNTFTYSEYLETLSSDNLDKLVHFILGEMKGISTLVSLVEEAYGDMHRNMQRELLVRGYKANDVFFIKETYIPHTLLGDVRFDVYDVSTGKVITSRTLKGAYFTNRYAE